MKKLKVIELFAGVGGFRLGLEKKGCYTVVWSNQWEPRTKKQHASDVYTARFGNQNHSNQNIAEVKTSDIPDADVLVGGFPCQDYSVATTLKDSKGLIGKKGVLWWSIHRILSEKENPPNYLILENVDRLLKSPSTQRGRDFAIILKSLDTLGYAVEWRVINAADYGMPQRRRRVFIIAYRKTTSIFKRLKITDPLDWMLQSGGIASTFPVKNTKKQLHDTSIKNMATSFPLTDSLLSISKHFNEAKKLSPFENTGVCIDAKVITIKSIPNYHGQHAVLGDILQKNKVDSTFRIPEEDFPKWEYLKGAKKEIRTSKNGFEYHYNEGGMIFPDALDKASRTIITGEGGKSPSRFKHVIQTEKGLRRLTPLELERLNMFPDNHTLLEGISDTKRAFFMGNALVVGIIEKLSDALIDIIQN